MSTTAGQEADLQTSVTIKVEQVGQTIPNGRGSLTEQLGDMVGIPFEACNRIPCTYIHNPYNCVSG